MNNILCIEDLRGKSVGTETGTTSEMFLKKVGAKIVSFNDIEDAYQSVKDKELDAAVFDSPNVIYFSKLKGDGRVTVIEKLFDKQYYGFE